ncbi:hypothetical protein MVES_002773 [Malassezia vespertilionis]|uniref:Inhibitor of growth protein N-terminal histone-binding domain-containing protein n=1 Tax=Malassezia vespertilionis TaxID=2020962 RepID=A0A2N1J8X6_9BASI|nr:hypothetical protein MVES_002773 [Malassezia vespertilionis]
MMPMEYTGMHPMRDAIHPALAASMSALHPFFSKSRLPDTPLSEDDIALFMLLVTYSDALDALPLEFTRSFSDLRELDAVLGGMWADHTILTPSAAHLYSLSLRLNNLAAMIEDPEISPAQRLIALKEVADEARAYKMGGEDKIRVAVNTAEMVRCAERKTNEAQIASHMEYMDSILRSFTTIPQLRMYTRDCHPHFKRHCDQNMYASHEEIIPMPGSVPQPTASSSMTRDRERDLHDGPRNTKKRKTMPPQAAGKGRSAHDADAHERSHRNVSAAQNGNGASKRRGETFRGRNAWGDGYGSDDMAESHGEANGHSRGGRSNRGRGRGDVDDMRNGWSRGYPAEKHDRGLYDAPQAMNRSVTADTSSVRGSARGSRSAKTGTVGSGREDADDQRYCFCNNVSYGDMIGCDDDECDQ